MTVQEKLITAKEFAALPDDGKRYDLVKGALVEMGRPKPRHGHLAIRLGSAVNVFVDSHNLGIVTTESGYVLARDPDTVVGPDVAFLSKARLEKPDLDEYIPLAPDLAVEIVSPNDRAQEINDKVNAYLAAGTRLVWTLYPDSQEVHVHQGNGTIQVIKIDGVLDGGDALPGFTLPLREIFKGLGD
jgi:Uma2 family endonuclease